MKYKDIGSRYILFLKNLSPKYLFFVQSGIYGKQREPKGGRLEKVNQVKKVNEVNKVNEVKVHKVKEVNKVSKVNEVNNVNKVRTPGGL